MSGVSRALGSQPGHGLIALAPVLYVEARRGILEPGGGGEGLVRALTSMEALHRIFRRVH